MPFATTSGHLDRGRHRHPIPLAPPPPCPSSTSPCSPPRPHVTVGQWRASVSPVFSGLVATPAAGLPPRRRARSRREVEHPRVATSCSIARELRHVTCSAAVQRSNLMPTHPAAFPGPRPQALRRFSVAPLMRCCASSPLIPASAPSRAACRSLRASPSIHAPVPSRAVRRSLRAFVSTCKPVSLPMTWARAPLPFGPCAARPRGPSKHRLPAPPQRAH